MTVWGRVLILGVALTGSLALLATTHDSPAPAAVSCPHLLTVLPGLCTHGNDPQATGPDSSSPVSGSVVCDGDGTSGRRVQVLVGRASDVPDHLSDAQPVTWAQGVDGIFDASAQQTGGHRHVRYVTRPDCSLDVRTVVLPENADDDFSQTITALQALGYNRPDRKYLIFLDASVYCGIATLQGDDQPYANNANNANPGYSRVDRVCWNAGTAAHELTHNLGGVQLSAPHSDGTWHCTTSYEVMCYGGTQTYPCPQSNQNYLDCQQGDYYDTNPPAGSYLSSHWNVATSPYLIGAPALAPSPTPSPSPSHCKTRILAFCF